MILASIYQTIIGYVHASNTVTTIFRKIVIVKLYLGITVLLFI